MITWIAFDTETALIRPGKPAPELACLTWCAAEDRTDDHPSTWPASLVDRHVALDAFEAWIRHPGFGLVGHNVAYDVNVLAEAYRLTRGRDLMPAIFAAYDAGRITDTMRRQQLLDIAAGCYRGEFRGDGSFRKYAYDLGSVASRVAGMRIDKSDPYRLRYGEFLDVPISEWPEGARTYPLDDARATLAVYLAQEAHADPFLRDQYRQARNAQWRAFTSAWGLRTRAAGVEAFAEETEARIAEVIATLTGAGLVRANGVRDTKAAARRMATACAAKGLSVPLTDGGAAKVREAPDPEAARAALVASGDGIALDADACKRAEDPTLDLYAEFGVLRAVQSRDLKMLREGATLPIHTRFDLADTGRTTSSGPNVQNIRGLEGIRECFIPRPGYVYAQADFPGLELRTLAQACLDLFGESRLASVLNTGADPHLMLAATIRGISYEEAIALHAAHDKGIGTARKLAKVANFGFPGGLGIRTFQEYAAGKPYNLRIGESEARALKSQWQETWPEMVRYFAHVSELCERGGGEALAIHQIRSERIRGKVRYTAACNGYFQGLGADVTGGVGWEIARACYVLRESPLFGSRMVNYVHDEFITETIDDSPEATGGRGTGERASAAAWEQTRIMRDAANVWLPDVPFTKIEPVLMSHWSKGAESLIDETTRHPNGLPFVRVWRG